jgi:hypothetical protein
MNVEKIIKNIESQFIFLITFMYGWFTSEGEVLGYILGVIHVVFCITLILLSVVSHTIYPAFWLQAVVFITFLLIWIQHIFLKVCVIFTTEYQLTKNQPPFYTLIHFFTNLSPTDWAIHFMVAETVAVGCLGLSLIGRISLMIHQFYNIEL